MLYNSKFNLLSFSLFRNIKRKRKDDVIKYKDCQMMLEKKQNSICCSVHRANCSVDRQNVANTYISIEKLFLQYHISTRLYLHEPCLVPGPKEVILRMKCSPTWNLILLFFTKIIKYLKASFLVVYRLKGVLSCNVAFWDEVLDPAAMLIHKSHKLILARRKIAM